MNTPTNPNAPDMQRLHELLPFHAVGALVGDDLVFVEHWLAQHGASHPEVTAELAWLRRTATQARENAHEPQAQAGLGALMARIAAERPVPVPATPGLAQRLLAWWSSRPALGMALAAVVLVQTVVIGSFMQREGAEQAPLSGSVTPALVDAVVFSVAFKSGVSEAAMRELLQREELRVVGGPSALGLWRVAADKARADAALAALQGAVVIVESVQREP